MTKRVSLEEAFGAGSVFTPADRTSKKAKRTSYLDPSDYSAKPSGDVRGELPQDQTIFEAIRSAAEEFGVPVEYGLALAQQESGYNPQAHNDEFGADGLFQFIQSTAEGKGLVYGVDTRDPAKAARAAMEDFATQMNKGGIDWAIKHHFAGPNTAGHGPKTAQYLADVSKRAADIQALLGQEPNPAAVAGVGGSSDAGPKQKVGRRVSVEEAFGTEPVASKEETPMLDARVLMPGYQQAVDDLGEMLGGAWNSVKNRILSRTGGLSPDHPDYIPERDEPGYEAYLDRTISADRKRQADQEAELDAKLAAIPEDETLQRALTTATHRSLPDLIFNDSLPANALEWLLGVDEVERKKILKARETAQQEKIVANPEGHSPEAVEAAQAAVDHRKSMQDSVVRTMWNDLKKAAKEDPGRMAGMFAQALAADPEMLLAPVGVGLKPVQASRIALTGRAASAGAKKATKTADRILDAAGTGAAVNLAIEAAAKGSEGENFTAEDAATAAALGGVLSGPFGVFFRGNRAMRKARTGQLGEVDLEKAMREVAQEELLVEQLVDAPQTEIIWTADGPLPADARLRIEKTLGIDKMSPDQRKAWHAARQKEISKTFKDNWEDANYLQFKAEERMLRTQQLAEEAEARAAQQQAEAQRQAAETAAYVAPRREAWQSEYDKALQARQNAANAGEEAAAAAEDKLRETTAKLDEQDIIEAAYENSTEVRNAMLRAAQRDEKLATPKWQRGEIDPKLVARLGIGSLFAGTAFAVAPKDQKAEATIAGALAGLMIPGGGNVLRKLAQSGATTVDGDIISLLAKQGKLKIGRDATEQMAREKEVIANALQGDQQAFQELFTEHYPRLERYIKKQLGGAGTRMGVEPADVAQEVMADVLTKLDKFSGDVPFSAYLTQVAKNKVVNVQRQAQSVKRGKDVAFKGLGKVEDDALDDAPTDFDPEVESATATLDSPEAVAIRQETESILVPLIENLPDQQKRAFILAKIEQFTIDEVATITGRDRSAVWRDVKAAEEKIAKAVEREFSQSKIVRPTSEVANSIDGIPVKRGRGRPKGSTNKWRQSGEIDPRLLKVGGLATLGAGIGAYLSEENKLLGASLGALAPVLLSTKGRKGTSMIKQVVEQLDDKLGVVSTRIMNKSKALWWRAHEHERVVLRDTHKHMKAVDPFLVKLQRLPKQTRDILSRAILTGKPEVTNRILQQLGDQELIASWKNVRRTLDSLGDQLVELKRFARKELDYFPRVVKDVEGLLKALGKERGSYLEKALKVANDKAIKARGSALTDLEKSLVINKVLKEDKWPSQQPGFAKERGVEEITPELQKFYATPTESLHSYIRSAVEDIERAKFFGRDLQVISKEGKEYTNVGNSIGALTHRLMNEGKLTPNDAEEIADILRTRFQSGEKAPNEVIQGVKNLSYAGLLGNPFSAAVQLGDVFIQAYTQDIRATLEAVARKLTGRKIISMKDFGLVDHIAEEFVSTSKSAKFLKKAMTIGLFRAVDEFGKDVALNAAVIRFGRLAKTEGGIAKIAQRYGDALGPAELKQLVTDLQKGERSDLVNSVAFAELTRTQPVTRLEMPQAYLKHPDGRLLYQFKTFMIKQIDLARRDAYNEIKAGNVAKGLRNLTALGITMGVAGTATAKIKDFMLGRDVEWKASDIPMNMLKTYGLSEYFIDHFFGVSKEEAAQRRADGDKGSRKIDAAPTETTLKMFVPPYKMFDEIVRGDPKAVRYIPIIGPYLYEQHKADKEKK